MDQLKKTFHFFSQMKKVVNKKIDLFSIIHTTNEILK